MKRFNLEYVGPGDAEYVGPDTDLMKMSEYPNGDWVRFDDASAVLEALEKLLFVQQSVTRVRCDSVGDTYDEVCEAARSVIAKAKGAS